MFNLASHLETLKSLIVKGVILGGTLLIGLVWLSIGFGTLLKTYLGDIGGPMAIGVAFVLPTLFYVLHKGMAPKKVEKVQTFSQGSGTEGSVLAISKMIEAMSGVSPFASAAVAVAAGFMVTRYPSLLNVFAQLVTAFAEDLKVRKAKKETEEAAKEAEKQKAGTAPPPPDIE